MAFSHWASIFLAGALALAAQGRPLVRCDDAKGGVQYTDQPCPVGSQQRGVAPPAGSRSRGEPLPPETRARISAEVQAALEERWQREVSLVLDRNGLRASNLTAQEVFWHLGTEEPVAFIPASLPGNRIAPGHTLRLDGRGATPGKVLVFYWWYKGAEIEQGSGLHGPDRVRRVLLQVPVSTTTSSREQP